MKTSYLRSLASDQVAFRRVDLARLYSGRQLWVESDNVSKRVNSNIDANRC